MLFLLIYLLIINVITFFVYGIDKWKAAKNRFRIKEATLLSLAVIGGSVGALLGMYTFRHKTKKWYFKFGVPMILLLQIALVVFINTHI